MRPELAQVASERHWEGMETLVQRLNVVETALAAVRGLLEVVGARRAELLELEAALERRLAVIESRPVIGVPRNRTEEGHAGFAVRDEQGDPHRTPTLPTPRSRATPPASATATPLVRSLRDGELNSPSREALPRATRLRVGAVFCACLGGGAVSLCQASPWRWRTDMLGRQHAPQSPQTQAAA